MNKLVLCSLFLFLSLFLYGGVVIAEEDGTQSLDLNTDKLLNMTDADGKKIDLDKIDADKILGDKEAKGTLLEQVQNDPTKILFVLLSLAGIAWFLVVTIRAAIQEGKRDKLRKEARREQENS